MTYLLDTCIIAVLLNGEPGCERLEERIAGAPRGSLQISAITAVEIWIGLARARTPRGMRIPGLTIENWLRTV